MKEKHICIYTMPDTLKHKQGLVEGEGHYYWELTNIPALIKKAWIDEEDSNRVIRVYFAINKQIVGSFEIVDIDWGHQYFKMEWDTTSWEELKEPIPCKPFQGFKYVQGDMR
ncbi:MAG: hypothetical protein KAR08_11875 [Candidatus Heimdallarchaeota archaeon]|nr:hypothetical protein [Candidatus Heimdallarchaeota archaeon]